MRPHRTCFEKFAESLTLEESAAVRQWLNVGYDIIRGFQSEGGIPEHLSFQQVEALERYFSNALSKAVVCTEMVFRGLSIGNWRPERIEFLRGLIHGPEEITFPSHDSATLSEEIGRDWCRIGRDDEERHLSVFLRVQPRTARYLVPFKHLAKDEEEVVLLKGARYRRISRRRLPDPKLGLEYWEVDLIEESEGRLHFPLAER
jgi:hypothetical protein